ncbi:MAG: four helix bundle protein [Planctomycetia bacterium]|nr:four helix bundle protein [Planctomycetia bacterium]
MSSVRSYRDLVVWQLAMQLVRDIYLATESFSKSEAYGLVSQLRRCAISIPSNIAEGHARESSKEYLHHISIAMGSVAELETQIILARDLNFLEQQTTNKILTATDALGRRLRGLQKSMRAKLK